MSEVPLYITFESRLGEQKEAKRQMETQFARESDKAEFNVHAPPNCSHRKC